MRREKMRGIPRHLRHKPIYGMNRYETMDGVHKHNTDVVGMSVGKAQWCGDIFEPSVKIWRDIRKGDNSYRIFRPRHHTRPCDRSSARVSIRQERVASPKRAK